MSHERIYICSQYGNREDELTIAVLACRKVITEGNIPVCPHLFFSRVLHDEKPEELRMGVRIGMELMKDCSELQVWSRISERMKEEIREAGKRGIPVTVGDMGYLYSEDEKAWAQKDILQDLVELREELWRGKDEKERD